MIALLLLVAYLGQSLLAVGAPCFMSGPDTGGEFGVLADSGHAGHHMDTVDQFEAGDSGCCDGGFCSMSHCQSVAALPAGNVTCGMTCSAAFIPSFFSASPNHTAASLYRPPISG